VARYILAPAAARDIQAILAHSQERFGEQARLRYEALIVQAILDIAEDPEVTGSASRAEIAESARTYHLYYSRNRVASPPGGVKRPRHVLLYRITVAGDVEIGRVLHDSMELERHLPQGYRPETGEESESASP
jgi:toxin ParE1/3/4